MNMKTGQVAGSAPAGQKSAEDIESEVARRMSTFLMMVVEDARRGTVKVTEGRDPKRRDWIDAKNAGRREDATLDPNDRSSKGKIEERKVEPDGNHASEAIQTASQDLKRLGQLGGGNDQLQRAEGELAKIV